MKKVKVNEEFKLDDGMKYPLIAKINEFGQLTLRRQTYLESVEP
jgi:hypothetical protein